MTDTKKPTLSEIRAQTEAARKGGFAGPAIPYLLDLVARMGDFAESVSSFEKDGMVVTGKGPIMLLVKQARALIEEIKQ